MCSARETAVIKLRVTWSNWGRQEVLRGQLSSFDTHDREGGLTIGD